MGLDLDYRIDDFRRLSQEAQIAKCRQMADEASRWASNASGQKRDEYLSLAIQWIALAEEMERSYGR